MAVLLILLYSQHILMGMLWMLMFVLLAVLWRQFVWPSEKLLRYITARSRGEALPALGRVPKTWLSRFVAIEKTFIAKEALENEIRLQNRELKQWMESRARELAESNRLLKTEIKVRRQAEKALCAIFNSVEDAILVCGPDGSIRNVNDKMLEMFAISRKASLARSITEFYLADDDDVVKAKLLGYRERAMAGEMLNFELKARRPIDGSVFDAEIMLKKVTLSNKDMILANFRDITVRKRAEEALKKKESYLRTIMESLQTGILMIDPESREIEYANSFAAKMIGVRPEELVGCNDLDYICFDRAEKCAMQNTGRKNHVDRLMKTASGEIIQVRISHAPVQLNNRTYFLQNLSDITDIKELLKNQEINIGLAKNILNLTNSIPSRHIDLSRGMALFCDCISVPCHAEGGDHYFVRTLPGDAEDRSGKTVLSLKDQSGHKVGCILRSIIADLMHHSLLSGGNGLPLESVAMTLNDEICQSRLFQDDEFFSAINIEIDHETLVLRYVSAGHPPFLLIRGDEIKSFPERDGMGVNIPMGILFGAAFSAGEIQLQEGDKLLFYTDGLTEMPRKNYGRIIKIEELKRRVVELLRCYPEIPVSELMKKILASVSNMSKETVVPAVGDMRQQNTSADDVTMLCLEIENDGVWHETVLKPRNDEDAAALTKEVYRKIAAQWQQRGFDAPEIRVGMVLEEALLNAWQHGNHRNPQKSITIRWRFGNDFRLMVTDEGQGFDHEGISDPTARENLTRECGRGIFIIRHYADVVDWKAGGRQVVGTFKKHYSRSRTRGQKQAGSLMKLWELPAISDDLES